MSDKRFIVDEKPDKKGEGRFVVDPTPSRQSMMQDHVTPKKEQGYLSDADLNRTVGKAKPAPKETISEAPKFLGSYALHDIKRKVKGVLWGDRTSPKSWDDKSGFEKRGVLGQAVATATGIPLVPEDQQEMAEELARSGGGMAGGIYGFKQGMKTGDPRKALVGGVLGSSLGYSAAKVAQKGELPTVGEQTRELMYGAVPAAVKPGVGIIKGAAQLAPKVVAINENALQAQSILDEGKILPVDPISVIERNFAAAGLGTILGGVAGKTIPKGVDPLNNPEMQAAVKVLENRVAKFKRLSTSGKGGRDTRGGREAAKKAFNQASSDLRLFLKSYPQFLDTKFATPQAVRISQVVRQGIEGKNTNTDYDTAMSLQDTYKLFKKVEDPELTDAEKFRKVMDTVRTHAASKFRPLESAEEQVNKRYGKDAPAQDLAASFETHAGSYAKADLDIRNFDTEVTDRIHDLAPRKFGGLLADKSAQETARKDFDVLMFLRRTKQRLESNRIVRQRLEDAKNELKEITQIPKDQRTKEERDYIKVIEARVKEYANKPSKEVKGYDLERIEGELSEFKKQMGEDRFASLMDISVAFQKKADEALQLQVASGRMPQEVYDAIKKENDFYAPFSLQEYSDEAGLVSGGGAIDTQKNYTQAIKGITKEFRLEGIVERMRELTFESRILAEKNMRMQRLKEVADTDTEGVFFRELAPSQKPDKGFGVVNVLVEGKQVRYQVSKDVEEAVKNIDIESPFWKTAVGALNAPFKYGATALNIPFQAKNMFLADAPRAALVSNYGVKNPKEFVGFVHDYAKSLYSAFGGQLGKGDKLYHDALEAGVLRSSLQSMITPEAISDYRAIGKGEGVLNNLSKVGNAIEESWKIMGVKRAMKMHGAENVQELLAKNPEAITEIRRYMGSPDFSRFGKSMDNANLLFMFANARMQGTLSDVSRAPAKSALSRLALGVGAPTATLYAYNQINHAEDLKKVPKRDRDNYFIIFKGTTRTNKYGEDFPDYWKIPKREMVKLFSNSVEASLDFMRTRDPEGFKQFAIKTLENISPVNIEGQNVEERFESVVSSTAPIARIFMGGRLSDPNPRDYWRHRDLLPSSMADSKTTIEPRDQHFDSTPEEFIELAHYIDERLPNAPEFMRSPVRLQDITQTYTAGLLTQFLPKQEMAGREDWENSWFMRAFGSSFQASGYIERTEDQKVIKQLQREQKTETFTGMRDSRKFVEARTGKKAALILREALEAYPPVGEDGKVNFKNQKMFNRITDRIKEKLKGVSPEVQELKRTNLNDPQLAKYIIYKLNDMSETMRRDYMNLYLQEGVLDAGVLKHSPELFEMFRQLNGNN